jgi:outer membrane receptor protein involved in Fe transport
MTTSAATPTASSNKPVSLDEVIVTAQKREERLQDVPVPITAISAESLVDTNQLRIQDYFASIPGLSYSPGIHGEPLLVIRGLTTDPYTNPTVAYTVDDVPYGASTALGGGYAAPDIDPSNLARIEVLRGPQGTLYGASSLGGLIRYVTIDPSTNGVSGGVQASTNSVYNGNELGYGARGSLNLPLGSTLAVRVSGFTRRDPGYIDDPINKVDGVNWGKAYGGSLTALWRPSDVVSLRVGAMFQNAYSAGLSEVDQTPGLTGLQQHHLLGTGTYNDDLQVYSANLTVKLGSATLTSVSGYTIDSARAAIDASDVFAAPVVIPDTRRGTRFTQEIRLAAPIGQRLDWLIGLYYNYEDTPEEQQFRSVDPSTGEWLDTLLVAPFRTTNEEYAVFTDFTYRITDRLDVQIGGRGSHLKQTFNESLSGPYSGSPTPIIFPEGRSEAGSFTYLFTPRFKLSPNAMVYARLASGYRPGGPNANTEILPNVPQEFKPDKTQNYEVGAKISTEDHAFSFDGSLYYIDWKDLQLQLSGPGGLFTYYTNAGRAKSQGVELAAEAKPLTGLSISAWAVWNEAILTEPLPANATVYGAAGDRLPLSSRFSANLSLQQDFRVTGSINGFAGAAVSYVGYREGSFAPPQQRQSYPSYAKTDLRAGAKYGTWTLNLFANNVTDRRGILTGNYQVPTFTYIQPRTIGISMEKAFY